MNGISDNDDDAEENDIDADDRKFRRCGCWLFKRHIHFHMYVCVGETTQKDGSREEQKQFK